MKRRSGKGASASSADDSASDGANVPAVVVRPHYRALNESYATNLLYGHVISRAWNQFGRHKTEDARARKTARATADILRLDTPMTPAEREQLRIIVSAQPPQAAAQAQAKVEVATASASTGSADTGSGSASGSSSANKA